MRIDERELFKRVMVGFMTESDPMLAMDHRATYADRSRGKSERTKDYKQLLQRLLDLGYEVKVMIIDGKRGLYKAFKDYPVQMCHFHQKKVIQRYITMHPRLEAGKDLQKNYV